MAGQLMTPAPITRPKRYRIGRTMRAILLYMHRSAYPGLRWDSIRDLIDDINLSSNRRVPAHPQTYYSAVQRCIRAGLIDAHRERNNGPVSIGLSERGRLATEAILMNARYTVRRPGCTAWAQGLRYAQAQRERDYANGVVPGHQIIMEGR